MEPNLLANHRLVITFRPKRVLINLQNAYGKNYLSLTPGLFLRFLNKKKSFKKNKSILLLMGRYMRKIFMVLELTTFNLLVKKTPYNLPEFLNRLLRPLPHRFIDPFHNLYLNERKFGP